MGGSVLSPPLWASAGTRGGGGGGGGIFKIRDWNIYPKNVYGALVVGSGGTKWFGIQAKQ